MESKMEKKNRRADDKPVCSRKKDGRYAALSTQKKNNLGKHV